LDLLGRLENVFRHWAQLLVSVGEDDFVPADCMQFLGAFLVEPKYEISAGDAEALNSHFAADHIEHEQRLDVIARYIPRDQQESVIQVLSEIRHAIPHPKFADNSCNFQIIEEINASEKIGVPESNRGFIDVGTANPHWRVGDGLVFNLHQRVFPRNFRVSDFADREW